MREYDIMGKIYLRYSDRSKPHNENALGPFILDIQRQIQKDIYNYGSLFKIVSLEATKFLASGISFVLEKKSHWFQFLSQISKRVSRHFENPA